MYPGVSPDITHTHIYILICVLVHTTWTAFILNIFFYQCWNQFRKYADSLNYYLCE